MSPNDADGMANSVDPDQTAPLAVWSGSALFAQAYLSENLGSLRYFKATDLNFHVASFSLFPNPVMDLVQDILTDVFRPLLKSLKIVAHRSSPNKPNQLNSPSPLSRISVSSSFSPSMHFGM